MAVEMFVFTDLERVSFHAQSDTAKRKFALVLHTVTKFQLFSFSQSNNCGTKYVMMMSAPEKPITAKLI